MNYEMRWVIRPSWDGPEKVLQYRYEFENIDYSMHNTTTGSPIKTKVWSNWIDVPTVDETNENIR